jgi:FKBP-type peptidyl-prolyl cis-trans isomerase (trigger factor)
MTQVIKAVSLTLITALVVSPALAQDQAADEVVVELGARTVTQGEFDERFNLALRSLAQRQGVPLNDQTRALFDQLKPNYLEQVATEQALLQEAESRGISVSDEEVDTQIQQIRQNYETEAAYNQFLTETGFEDEATFSDFIRENLLVQRVVEQLGQDIEVTNEQVQTFYNENQAQINAPLEQARDQIRQQLQREELNARIADVREASDVQVFPENLGIVSGMSGSMSGGGMSGGGQ